MHSHFPGLLMILWAAAGIRCIWFWALSGFSWSYFHVCGTVEQLLLPLSWWAWLDFLSFSPLFLPRSYPIHSSFIFLSSLRSDQGVWKVGEWLWPFYRDGEINSISAPVSLELALEVKRRKLNILRKMKLILLCQYVGCYWQEEM